MMFVPLLDNKKVLLSHYISNKRSLKCMEAEYSFVCTTSILVMQLLQEMDHG